MANVVDFSGLGFGTYILQQNILTAFAVFFLSILALRIFRGRVISLIKKLAEKTKSNLDDLLIALVERIPWTFYVLVSAYLSISFLVVPQVVTDVLWYAIVFVIVYYGIRATYIFIDHFRDQLIERRIQTDPKEDVSFIRLLANIVKYSMWVVGGLLILANMKIDISALLAGMGVGGIAIALAAQNVFEDIFSSFSIYFDKPFRIGDFIIIGDDMGVVDKIGVKTTRIKTLRGEELVVSNREMTSTRIHNFGKMPHRRIDFKFGVTYQTPVEKMKKIPQMVREIIESQELVKFDRAHFKSFGNSTLDFEVVYYLHTADYNKYMDTQQAINLGIMDAFEREGIEFAYPTQTIYMGK